MIKISCIVPVFNVEMFLTECLVSLVKQTMKSIEIIIVNDGSNDNSLKIAENFMSKYKNIKIINKDNGGLSSARNAGIKDAKGEYICFIDSDDFISLDALEILYDVATKNKLDIVKAKYDLYDDEKKCIMKYKKNLIHIPSENKVISGIQYIKESINSNSYEVIVCNSIFRREYIIKNNIFFKEGVKYEDHEFTLRTLIQPKCKLMCIDKIYYYYRQRKGSITKTFSIDSINDICLNLKNLYEIIDNLNIENKRYIYRVISILINAAYFQYKNFDKNTKKKAKLMLVSAIRKRNIIYAYNKKVAVKTLILVG